jgi:hypothetical protein
MIYMARGYIGDGSGDSKENAITIETFEDLLKVDVAENSNKYVKIMQDINVGNESWWTGSTDKSLYYCNYFADTRKKIEGLVVSGVNFIGRASGSNASFENLDIINGCYKLTGAGWFFGRGTVSGSPTFLKSCTVSFRVVNTGSYSITPDNMYTIYEDTSIYIVGSGAETNSFTIPAGKFTRCNVVFDSLYINSGNSSTNNILSSGTYSSASFIFRNCKFTNYSNAFNVTGGSNRTQTYLAFDNCDFSASTLPLTVTSNQPVVLASNASTYPFVNTSNTAYAKAILATMVDSTDPSFDTSSVRSKQFLINCGFLP